MIIFYYLKLGLVLFCILVNTLVLACALFVFTLLKVILPIKPVRKVISLILIAIARAWITINDVVVSLIAGVKVNVSGVENLDCQSWYMVTSNHQSWADILILQRVFNRKVPFLKFFLKQELIKVPILGLAWWALDFPFMKRYTRDEIKANPSLKGKDLETTRIACEKFKEIPTSVTNFFEGTRFTKVKHDRQQSPYQYLLKPKSGGMAFALSAMQGQLTTLLDVTIIYPEHAKTRILPYLGGRIKEVTVVVKQRPIPQWTSEGDYQDDPQFRARFHRWVASIWQEKDQLLQQHYQDKAQ